MTTPAVPAVLCIGALHWDLLAHAPGRMCRGDDLPGRVVRRPGGVATNIALALAASGQVRPLLCSAVGEDADGLSLCAALERAGVQTRHVQRAPAWRTGTYLAIEDAGGLVAAVADLGALDAAGSAILASLGRRAGAPDDARIPVAIIDSNLALPVFDATVAALDAGTDLRVVAASPARIARLRVGLIARAATVYLNLAEAAALLDRPQPDAASAAAALLALGIARVVVTDGARRVADALRGGPVIECLPPRLSPRAVTGAGDAFVAGHVLAETVLRLDRIAALTHAVERAAAHLTQAA